MKSLFFAMSLISTLAFADTAKIGITGMHCSSCKALLTKSVCENETLAKSIDTCSVKLTDEKTQAGEINIVTKPEAKLDMELVKAQVAAAGEYKVASVDVKSATMAADTEKFEPNSKVITTTTTTETAITDAAGNTEIKKEVKVKKTKTASKTTTKKATK